VLLPFYRAYRAAVRGKVAGMKLADPEVPDEDKAAARAKARARWLFALRELEVPARKPCLLLVGGLPGAGKSTLAGQIGQAAGFAVIRSDVVRKELWAEAEDNGSQMAAPTDIYSEEWNERTYQECLQRAEAILFEGGRALIDASFHAESRRKVFLEAGRHWGIRVCFIICAADPQIVRQRLDERRGDASDADWTIHTRMARRWEELSPETRALSRTIDTSGTHDQALRDALDMLREFELVRE
jgi:predicted kinase